MLHMPWPTKHLKILGGLLHRCPFRSLGSETMTRRLNFYEFRSIQDEVETFPSRTLLSLLYAAEQAAP